MYLSDGVRADQVRIKSCRIQVTMYYIDLFSTYDLPQSPQGARQPKQSFMIKADQFHSVIYLFLQRRSALEMDQYIINMILQSSG